MTSPAGRHASAASTAGRRRGLLFMGARRYADDTRFSKTSRAADTAASVPHNRPLAGRRLTTDHRILHDVIMHRTFQLVRRPGHAIRALPLPAPAQNAPLKTRNVVLIVSDGLRWQEIFTGADPTLLNEKHGGIWDKEADLRREFWRDDPERAPQGAVPVPVDDGRRPRPDLRQPGQGQRRPRHQRPGVLVSGLQRDAHRDTPTRASTPTSSARTRTSRCSNG